MSLAEVCGMANFANPSTLTTNHTDITNFCRNFTNNLELGVPPFANVSIIARFNSS